MPSCCRHKQMFIRTGWKRSAPWIKYLRALSERPFPSRFYWACCSQTCIQQRRIQCLKCRARTKALDHLHTALPCPSAHSLWSSKLCETDHLRAAGLWYLPSVMGYALSCALYSPFGSCQVHTIVKPRAVHCKGWSSERSSLLQAQRAYAKLRVERMNAKRDGMRKKRLADAAAAEKDK